MPYFVKNDSLGLDDKLKWEKCDNTNDNKPKTYNVQILGIFLWDQYQQNSAKKVLW